MKSYSSNTVTTDDLQAAVQAGCDRVANASADAIDDLDVKQNQQISQLRRWLAASFVANLVLTVVLHLM